MRVTVLETGRPPKHLRGAHPDYPEMFRALLHPADANLRFETVAVADNAPLPDPRTVEAVLITGSPAGVYDPEPWIEPLEDFIRGVAAVGAPQVGICFGHQIMAQAFGGDVRKSDKGWGVGRHAYEVVETADWMDPPLRAFALAASHQDQVIAPPPTARVIARSAHTEYAALAYAHTPAISFQGHPEMTAAFTADLVASRRGRIPDALVDGALESLAAPTDHDIIARWIVRFFRSAR